MLFLFVQLMKNNPIGIFDSGIGGLTVANAIKKVLPNEDFVYFGDTEHLPYGEKSKESILRFSKNIIRFLINKDCKAIVIACNSASSVMNDNLLRFANNIVVFNVIDPAAKLAVELANNSKSSEGETLEVGVIGVPDKKTTEAVKAVIVKKDESLTEDEIKLFCKEKLTNYKCPKHVGFMDELPKSNVGKILRRIIKEKDLESNSY